MSRLGDLIRTERLRSKMTPKQVARKCGVSESYLLAVEAGTKIIADDQARRILKTIGLREQTEADFSLDDIAATVDLASASPAVAKAVERPKPQPEYELVATTKTAGKKQDDDADKDENVTGSVWLDALTSVLKRVPIMNAVMQPVDYRLMPIQSGKIEGAKPDKVFYFLAPDDSMRGFRIHSGDLALIVPARSPIDGAIMLVEYNSHRFLRKIKKLNDYSVVAKAQAILRRSRGQSLGAGQLAYGSILLDTALREVTVDGRPIHLRPKEVQILEILLREQGRTVSRDTLIQKVWSLDFDGDERMVDRHVAALRQKLGTAAQHIKSVYGAGYRLGGKEGQR